jgi:hypothetical protein
MNCIADDSTQQHIIQAIDHAAPRPHHSALFTALGEAVPECAFRHVLTKAGWHRAGGVLTADGNCLSQELETWVNAELAKCDDDFGRFMERYSDAGLLATRHVGRSHYFVAAYGPSPEEFLQLEIEELQEVMDHELIDPERPPYDRTELVEPTNYKKLEAHPVGSPHYRFVRLSDIRQVLVQQNRLAGGTSALARFMSDWTQSRAMDSGHFCEHWLIAGLEHYQPDSSMPFSIAPVSVHARTLKPFHWDETKSGAEMGNQIRDFDRAAGYPGAWYFHFVASKFVPETLALALKRDLDNGYSYLAEKELGLLKKLVANPYRPGYIA